MQGNRPDAFLKELSGDEFGSTLVGTALDFITYSLLSKADKTLDAIVKKANIASLKDIIVLFSGNSAILRL